MCQHRDRGLARSANGEQKSYFTRAPGDTYFTHRAAIVRGQLVSRRVGVSIERARWIPEREGAAGSCSGEFIALGKCLRIPFPLEIIHSERVTFTLCHHLESHHDLFFFARSDRENSGAKQPVTHPFEKSRIPLLSHDLFIDRSRLR